MRNQIFNLIKDQSTLSWEQIAEFRKINRVNA